MLLHLPSTVFFPHKSSDAQMGEEFWEAGQKLTPQMVFLPERQCSVSVGKETLPGVWVPWATLAAWEMRRGRSEVW